MLANAPACNMLLMCCSALLTCALPGVSIFRLPHLTHGLPAALSSALPPSSNQQVVSYERPALSKAYLFPESPARLPGFHSCVGGGGERQLPEWYAEKGIDYLTGTQVTAVDLAAKKLTAASGEAITFDKLVVATGARVGNGVAARAGRCSCPVAHAVLSPAPSGLPSKQTAHQTSTFPTHSTQPYSCSPPRWLTSRPPVPS